MLTSNDLSGVVAMMPAFATPDAANLRATSTIDVENLRAGVDRIIADGIDAIATTGSFGEFHTLLDDEFQVLARATVEAVKKRVPLFVGCTSLNSREVIRKMRIAEEAGADGVLVGVPFYFPSTVENAVRFYHDIAELFPNLGIMVYHNPTLHNVTIPVDAFEKLTQSRNIVAMKDSHRDTPAFMKLMRHTRGKLSVFVNQAQLHPYFELGAAGCWSIDAWMGPEPVLALRDAVRAGDRQVAEQIVLDLSGSGGGDRNLSWRETKAKISIKFAGYCNPGPLRPPFMEIPESVVESARQRAEYWNSLRTKYAPRLKAKALASA